MKRIALALFLAASTAHAQAPLDANELIARGHFKRGLTAYNAARYEEAKAEFETANAAKPQPALVFNIARCLDALGRKTEAVTEFRHYLDLDSDADNAAAVRARVDVLEHQTTVVVPVQTQAVVTSPVVVSAAVSAPPGIPSRHVIPYVVGGGALALAAVGAGLLGSAAASFHDLQGSCGAGCSPSAWSGLPAREHAGEALLGVAGAVAIVDVVLWVVELKKGRR